MPGETTTLTRNSMLNCAEGECIIDVSSVTNWIFKGMFFIREESLLISTPDNCNSVLSLQTPMSDHSLICILSIATNTVYQVT